MNSLFIYYYYKQHNTIKQTNYAETLHKNSVPVLKFFNDYFLVFLMLLILKILRYITFFSSTVKSGYLLLLAC